MQRTRDHGRYARNVNLAQQIAAMERDLDRQREMAARMGRLSLMDGFMAELNAMKARWAALQAATAQA